MKKIHYKNSLFIIILFLIYSHTTAQIPVSSQPEKNNQTNREKKSARSSLDIVKFSNGDRISGELIEIDVEKSLIKWNASNIKPTLEADLTFVSEITLNPSRTIPLPESTSSVILSNGDNLYGKIISLDNEKIILDTPYAGKLNIKKNMINEILPSRLIIYQGPNNSSEWIIARHYYGQRFSFDVKNKTLILYPDVLVYSDLKLPDISRIDFTVTNYSTGMRFYFYGEKFAQSNNSYYCLSSYNNNFSLERFSGRTDIQILWRTDVEEILNKKNLNFTVLTNKKLKNISILLNNKLIKQVIDEKADFAGKGTCVAFNNQGYAPLYIKNITVSDWDGRIPSLTQPSEPLDKDLFFFANQDKASGKLISIKNDQAEILTDFTTLNVPLDKIKKIKMADNTLEKACLRKNDVHLKFTENNDRITVELKALKNNFLKGLSENFGETDFKVSYFDKILFRIYDKPQEEEFSTTEETEENELIED